MNKNTILKCMLFIFMSIQSAHAMEPSWKKHLAISSTISTLAAGFALLLIKTEVEKELTIFDIESAWYIPTITEAETIFAYYKDLDSADQKTVQTARERLADVKIVYQYPLIYAHSLVKNVVAELTTLQKKLHWQHFAWTSSSNQTESPFVRAQKLLMTISKSKPYALEVHTQQFPGSINLRRLNTHTPDETHSDSELHHAIMGSLANIIETPKEQ